MLLQYLYNMNYSDKTLKSGKSDILLPIFTHAPKWALISF